MDGSRLLADMRNLSALTAYSQHKRLLRMDFPRGDGPAGTVMLVNSLQAHEAVSRDFRFVVEVVSDDAHIELTAMMGRMVTISMVREDGTLRYFNGYVTQFGLIKADGGFVFYQMVLEPWLSFTKLHSDCVSFHMRSVIDITDDTFAKYRQRDWNTRLRDDDPKLTCANQYNESDYNHLHRRWEAHGIHYWYEHRADGHTLWLGDDSRLADGIDGAGGVDDPMEIPFRSEAGSLEDDGIHQWQAVRTISSGNLTLTSFDYKNPVPQRVSMRSLIDQGEVFGHEVHENLGSYGFNGSRDGEEKTERLLEAWDGKAQYFEAKGNDRYTLPGRSFKLGGHFSGDIRGQPWTEEPLPDVRARQYLILSVEHSASNNYHCDTGALSHYENKLTCIRKTVRWRPGRHFNSKPCPDPGVQTAIVVGPPGEDIYTDELGRVKLQFHWDRIGKYDVSSSPWIRVMMPLAGTNMGQMTIPRVKQEVAVQFLDGNVDHPVITGGVYDGLFMPPWNLPGQRALMGLRSRELSMGGSSGMRGNHLILDDTSGRIQAQLKSDHQHSQLSLGHITRIEDTSGRKDARGEGWELATNAWGVARAGRGMLITTESRPNAASHIKSMDETVQRLAIAMERHKERANLAQQFGAQEGGQQSDVTAAIVAQNIAIKGTGGDSDAFPELSEPHLILASPAGIETTTAQSTHIASAEHTALTTGRNLSIASGDSLFASISHTFRLFVHKAGMKLVAAAGKVRVEAKTDDIEIIAEKVLHLISQSDWVDIRARKGIRLHGSDSMVEISDTVQFFTRSPTLFHGNLQTLAPQTRPQQHQGTATPPTPEQVHYALQSHATGGIDFANVPYTLFKGGAKVEDGVTDEFGRIKIAHETGTPEYSVKLPNGEEFKLQVSSRFLPSEHPQHHEQSLSNQGNRALADSAMSRLHE
ncbi:MAG: type VI secretion system tip protein TssI/VgrG [Pseudomonadota bacterium]